MCSNQLREPPGCQVCASLSPEFFIRWHHVGNLKSVTVGAVTPQKLAHAAFGGCAPGSPRAGYLPFPKIPLLTWPSVPPSPCGPASRILLCSTPQPNEVSLFIFLPLHAHGSVSQESASPPAFVWLVCSPLSDSSSDRFLSVRHDFPGIFHAPPQPLYMVF